MHQSLLYCCNIKGFIANVRSLARGAGWHGYPPDWWKKSVKGFLHELALASTIPFSDIDCRFNEGRNFRRTSKQYLALCVLVVSVLDLGLSEWYRHMQAPAPRLFSGRNSVGASGWERAPCN